MTTTITFLGGYAVTPVAVLGYAVSRKAQTVVHDVLGRSDPEITLRPTLTRTGRLELGFATEAAALDAVARLSTPQPCQLADTDRSIAMTFVVTGGNIDLELEDETRDLWIVSFSFREVIA